MHDSECSVPWAKGEGVLLMVTDFASADYGWLQSPDGSESTHTYFKAGKKRSSYFTNDDILEQTEKVISILKMHYPDDDHILVFDNATTHLKQPDDALLARGMTKNPPEKPFHLFFRELDT